MSGIDQELRDFIRERIHSVGLIEVLQLLRETPDRSWSVAEVTTELRTSEPAAVMHLQELVAQGFATVPPEGEVRYRYRPASQWLDAMAERLVDAYRTRRVSVTQAIHSGSRDHSLRSFSDSFRLRED